MVICDEKGQGDTCRGRFGSVTVSISLSNTKERKGDREGKLGLLLGYVEFTRVIFYFHA